MTGLNRKNLYAAFWWLLLSAQPALIHGCLFPKEGAFPAVLVWFEAMLIWGLLLTLPRFWIIIAVLLQMLIAGLLISWHAHFDDALSIQVMQNQFYEGWYYATVAWRNLLTGPVLFLMALGAAQICILWKYPPVIPCPRCIRLIFGIPLAALLLFIGQSFHHCVFNFTDFTLYARNLGYGTAWLNEMLTNLQKRQLLDAVIDNADEPTPPLPHELQNMPLPEHLFIVQVESLDYAGFTYPRAMPFLNKLAEDSLVYRIRPKPRHQSANADFMSISKANNFRQYYFTIYAELPAEDYKKLPNLVEKAAAKGYRSAFYHGFTKIFYNRGEGCRNFGFDKCWFYENLPITEKKGAWGVDDADLLRFVLAQDRQSRDKQLHFIITVSSHENYEAGEQQKAPFARPRNRREKYLNTLNYVDEALQELIRKAPDNSLFLLYSDHHSNELPETSTLMLIYNKAAPRHFRGQIDYEQVPQMIHGLFDFAPADQSQGKTTQRSGSFSA